MQYRVIPPMSPRTKAMLPPRILTAAEWVPNSRCCQVRILTYELCMQDGRQGKDIAFRLRRRSSGRDAEPEGDNSGRQGPGCLFANATRISSSCVLFPSSPSR